jgi:hypothetical protein
MTQRAPGPGQCDLSPGAALNPPATFQFDFHLTDITREYFRQAAKTTESGGLAADMTRVAEGDHEAMRHIAATSPQEIRPVSAPEW